MEKIIKCAIYPRKSKQVDNSDSMEVQIDMCIRYLDEKYGKGNYSVKVYDGDYGITGHSTKQRKDFRRMMQDVKDKKIQLVLIQRYDRIARNTRDFCNLYHDMEEAGCNLVSVSQRIDTSTPYGKKFMYDLASTAELEWALNSERHKDVNTYARMRGKCNLSPYAMPFGYKAEIIDGVRRMVIDKEKEPIVRDALEHLKNFHSKNSTNRYINEKYGLNLSHSFVDRLLSSDFYFGKYRENENYCEPYMSKEEAMQIRSAVKKQRNYSDDSKYFLFTGLIKCPECKRKMESQSQKNTSGNRYYYYRCYAPYRSGLCSFRGNINEKEIERYIIYNMQGLIELYGYENAYLTQKTHKKVIDIEQYRKELNRLNNAYIKGRIEEEYYDSEYERIKAIIDNFEQIENPNQKSVEELKKLFNNEWIKKYLQLDRKNKRAIWQEIISEIELNPDKSIKMVHFK